MSSSLKIHNISLDKESWENVPGLVFKSFHVFQTNMGNIKKWSEAQEANAKQLDTHHLQTDSRIDFTDATVLETQKQLKALSIEVAALTGHQQKEAETFNACLMHLLDATDSFFTRFVRAFGAEETDEDERSEKAAPSWEQTDRSSAARSAEQLHRRACGLAAQLTGVANAFDRWDHWRGMEEEKGLVTKERLEGLRVAAEGTRERLLAWRETFKESAYVVDSLGAALLATQSDVRELQSTQVRHNDVEEVVGKRTSFLEGLHKATESRVDGIADRMNTHVDDVEKMVRELQCKTDDKVEEHSNKVSDTVERHMNPLNAYLNNMHVKADLVRMELDRVCAQVPNLSSCIDSISRQLGELDDKEQNRSRVLAGRIDELVNTVAQGQQKTVKDRLELSGSIQQLSEDLCVRIGGVRTTLEGTTEALELVKNSELANLSKAHFALEQKVAKWVHAQPLPAKISEARLYALEARLADEMDSRLKLEETMKHYKTFCSMSPLALPALERSTPRSSQQNEVLESSPRGSGRRHDRRHHPGKDKSMQHSCLPSSKSVDLHVHTS